MDSDQTARKIHCIYIIDSADHLRTQQKINESTIIIFALRSEQK